MPTLSNPDPFTQLLADARERGWQPIETAPRNISFIGASNKFSNSVGEIQWDCEAEGWRDYKTGELVTITHWMPLPELPENHGPALADIAEMAVEAIKDAPHEARCQIGQYLGAARTACPCTCWKAKVQARIENLLSGLA